MVAVVPGEEVDAVAAGVLDAADVSGELRPVLEGLELGFRERIVVRNLGPGVGLGDAQVRAKEDDRLAGHR